MAEQLSQLPNDMDVENMVEASYGVVLEHKLDKGERSSWRVADRVGKT